MTTSGNVTMHLLLAMIVAITAKRQPILTEVYVMNECPLNIKLRCQSVAKDFNDRFIAPGEGILVDFNGFVIGNRHFWCDVYALNRFDETFDIYGGKRRGKQGNMTWFIRPDGLYENSDHRVFPFHSWTHVPELYLEFNRASALVA